ncbi:MAG: hypothetical protein HONBIEJF_02655 [Fimbriimonadaceae bacterium]|nr:hypothetical protein [Fimbriimonadaceae bacterium]
MTTDLNQFAADFRSNGYAIAKGVYSPSQVAELEADFDRIVAQLLASGEDVNARWAGGEVDKLDAGKSVVIHTHNVQKFSSVWAKALFDDAFLDCCAAILGPDVVLHHTKLFQKPAEEGAPFPMHQDWNYFPAERDTMIAGVIHVSRATDEMGCLRVYPGSHRLGRVEGTWGGAANELLAQYPIEGSTPVEAEPGDVVFFHYLTIHGSLPNRSRETRKTVLVQLLSGSDAIEPGVTHPNERLVLRGWNSRIGRSEAGE